MPLSIRQTEILDLAKAKGRVLVDDLAQRFDVTLQTIRRDLGDMAEAGLLTGFTAARCRVQVPSTWDTRRGGA